MKKKYMDIVKDRKQNFSHLLLSARIYTSIFFVKIVKVIYNLGNCGETFEVWSEYIIIKEIESRYATVGTTFYSGLHKRQDDES